MACVTLKRPLDFDPLEVLHSPDRPQTKRRRCTPIKGLDRESSSLDLPKPPEASTGLPSVFLESVLSADEIASNLRDELKRLKHRRQLATQEPLASLQQPVVSPNSPEPMNQEANEGGNSSGSAASSSAPSLYPPSRVQMGAAGSSNRAVNFSCGLQAQQSLSTSSVSSSVLSSSSSHGATAAAAAAATTAMIKSVPSVRSWMGTRDKPVFTLKQMTLICERMCKERTEQVRQEYDRILQQKLCEQYDAFVKFIDQQIQERFHRGQLPSYLS